jgi:hypothetical protein
MQHLEYMAAKYIQVNYAPESLIEAAEDPSEDNVLSLFADEGVVITGTPRELVDLIQRMYRAVTWPKE